MAKALARIALDGYLTETGWLRSAMSGEVVDRDGQPLPWATLPFVAFITPRLRPEWRMFEYGAGASTRFYAARLAEVWAVEHDAGFADRLRPHLPANVRLDVRAIGTRDYAAAIEAAPFIPDVVSIDGRDRPACCGFAVQRLSPTGVIVFDDTERPEYAEALAGLTARGFRRLDFWGVSAGSELHRSTSVFYRADNVLGL